MKDISKLTLLKKLSLCTRRPWYHEIRLHLQHENAVHWQKYVLKIPVEEWKIKLFLVNEKPWLEQKGWFDNTQNDSFTEFYE